MRQKTKTKKSSNCRHNWEIMDPVSLYDNIYRCSRCNEARMVSIDNPKSAVPIYGCIK